VEYVATMIRVEVCRVRNWVGYIYTILDLEDGDSMFL
jgi:hypothetical protein